MLAMIFYGPGFCITYLLAILIRLIPIRVSGAGNEGGLLIFYFFTIFFSIIFWTAIALGLCHLFKI